MAELPKGINPAGEFGLFVGPAAKKGKGEGDEKTI
jgi:hypothetical protein